MKRCMYCGHENEDTADVCEVCGNKLGDAIPVDVSGVEVREVTLDGEPENGSGPQTVSREGDASENEPEDPGQTKGAGQAAGGEIPAADDGAQAGETRLSDEEMVTQEPAFAGQTPVNEQFAGTTPGGQFTGSGEDGRVRPAEEALTRGRAPARAAGPDTTPGYGSEWRQDVGRGQTYGARQQYEAGQGTDREERPAREQYGSAGYGYRQSQADAPSGRTYGRREGSGGSKAFMVRARKRVKSVTFFLTALAFTAMLALNAYNIYCGNAIRNINDADTMLANILGTAGTNFFAQLLSELAAQMVSMVANVYGIVIQLGQTVEMAIAVVFLVPNVLYCISLWLMFGQTSTKRRQFPTGGYTLARVMMTLKFIIACFVLAIGLVISVYFVVVSAQRSSAAVDSSLVQGVILLVLMILITIFVVMYYIQWMFCLKVVKLNSKTGADPGRMPAFLGVLSILCAAVCVLMMIPMASDDYVGLAARGAAAAYFLFSGLWVLLYKALVKRG